MEMVLDGSKASGVHLLIACVLHYR